MPIFRIQQITVGGSNIYWQFGVNLGSGFIDNGHCLGDSNIGYYTGRTMYVDGVSGMSSDNDDMRYRASGGGWFPWGNVACGLDENNTWQHGRDSQNYFDVFKGPANCDYNR